MSEDYSSNIFLISWDMMGVESIINVTAIEKENSWKVLKNEAPSSLGSIVNAIMLRARYNTHRHYEIYTITVSPEITEDDMRQLFTDNPQSAAELIRDRGRKIYSDRLEPNRIKIT